MTRETNYPKAIKHWQDIKEQAEAEDNDVFKLFGHKPGTYTFENIIEIAEKHMQTLVEHEEAELKAAK